MTKRCPTCRTFLPLPAPLSDGLAGVLYETCDGCGWTRAVTRRQPKERLPASPSPALEN